MVFVLGHTLDSDQSINTVPSRAAWLISLIFFLLEAAPMIFRIRNFSVACSVHANWPECRRVCARACIDLVDSFAVEPNRILVVFEICGKLYGTKEPWVAFLNGED
jgi:hypothetical protein